MKRPDFTTEEFSDDEQLWLRWAARAMLARGLIGTDADAERLVMTAGRLGIDGIDDGVAEPEKIRRAIRIERAVIRSVISGQQDPPDTLGFNDAWTDLWAENATITELARPLMFALSQTPTALADHLNWSYVVPDSEDHVNGD